MVGVVTSDVTHRRIAEESTRESEKRLRGLLANLSSAAIRRLLLPSIGWAAVTTAGAFAILNLSGLPGLAQLGSLVAMGITIAAALLWRWYLCGVCHPGPHPAAQAGQSWLPGIRRAGRVLRVRLRHDGG